MSNNNTSIHDFDFSFICNYFKLLKRQGPGSPEATRKAVSFINELTDDAKNFVVEGGYDPMYGARPLKRYLQKNVETLAAKLILAGDVGRGDRIEIDVVDGKLEAKVKGQIVA